MGQLVEKLSDKLAPMLRPKSPRHLDPPLEESDRSILSGMVQPGRVQSSCMFAGGEHATACSQATDCSLLQSTDCSRLQSVACMFAGYRLSLCLKGGVRNMAASAACLGMGRQEKQ